MNSEEIAVFNENVKIDNDNINILSNATIANNMSIHSVFDYVKEIDNWWMIMFVVVLITLILINHRVNRLEDKIVELENDQSPEREPLIVKPCKV